MKILLNLSLIMVLSVPNNIFGTNTDLATGSITQGNKSCALTEIVPPLSSNANILLASGTGAEIKPTEINPSLKAKIDAEIAAQSGDVNALTGEGNETRTLLMRYAEGPNANLDAIKYLVEVKGANLNILDTYYTPRTVLIYPSYYGRPDIVNYLATRPDKLDTYEARRYALGGLQSVYKDQNIYDQIIANLNLIDQK